MDAPTTAVVEARVAKHAALKEDRVAEEARLLQRAWERIAKKRQAREEAKARRETLMAITITPPARKRTIVRRRPRDTFQVPA
jgi:hypothetical protein